MHILSDESKFRDICTKETKGIIRIRTITEQVEHADYGKKFFHVTLSPGSVLPNNRQKEDTKICYILSGRLVFNDNGTEKIAQSGDICIVNRDQIHRLENRTKEPAEVIVLIEEGKTA